jgi:GH43 family beta-xylosidase
MIFHGGYYYYSETRRERRIFVRRARTIAGIAQDRGVCVWSAPSQGLNSDHIWGPELHLIDGRWFIYFAADDGRNENQRMWVLVSEGPNPCGQYRCRGQLATGGWAIDGTVMTMEGGRKFLVWSGRNDGEQNIYIAAMKDSITVTGQRVLIAAPDQAWERVAMPVCEGPQVLKRNGDTFIIYSASGSWTPDSCLGLLHNQSGDILNPRAWVKHGPVFKKTDQVWGISHCSFVKSLCQSEDWMVYHSKSGRQRGLGNRDVQARQFHWTSDGFPDFGTPWPRKAGGRPTLRGGRPAGLAPWEWPV